MGFFSTSLRFKEFFWCPKLEIFARITKDRYKRGSLFRGTGDGGGKKRLTLANNMLRNRILLSWFNVEK